MVSTTPELADSHGSEVKAKPVWASALTPTPAAHSAVVEGGRAAPYQTNITSGIRIQTEIH